jgi:hypothetical protein
MSFRLDDRMMKARLIAFGPRVQAGMVAAANYTAPRAEAYMKSNAPWVDRTAAARNGLGTRVIVAPESVSIVLFHSVSYGVYLETRWGGKYAIIEPTIQITVPEFLAAIKRLAFS